MATDVIIMAGGTGGHVFPALAVANGLRDAGLKVHWIGTPDSFEATIIPQHDFPITLVDIKGLRGKGLAGWFIAPFKMIKAIHQAAKVLKQEKPKCVMGFGGFAAGPGGVAAKLLGIPLIIHEQNAIAGLTNKLLAKISKRILVAFPKAFSGNNVIHIGNPVRAEIAHIKPPEKRLKPQNQLKILVLGGSLGALALNQKIPVALSKMHNKPQAIRHQCGREKLEVCQRAYQSVGLEANISEFINDMAEAYAWADLVICRAGALTISELSVAGIGAILVPYPYAVDDHQTANAQYLVENKAAICIQQADLISSELAKVLDEISQDNQRCLKMAKAARQLGKPKATSEAVKVCQQEMLL